ncbi:hypothetical protein BUALT_Bualt08G0083300 [Buddleja alternifolia]|uniref:Uncharacterized protein n=1 Tax=Buddleja alternifolia TaxID=168488 RepID=A0AAV6X546_9LAMI|nr:hypothetical protein BUALT_Bualt08G0083300 [Buddleja alternifolia]
MQRIRYEDFFLLIGRENENARAAEDMENIPCLCINHHDFSSTIHRRRRYWSHVRSILHFSYGDKISKNLFSFASGFKLLRVLEFLQLQFPSFPDEIVKLFHLRYLACRIKHSGHSISLPPSISKLQNLQTLIVYTANAAVSRYFISLPSCPPRQKMNWCRHLQECLETVPNLKKLEVRYTQCDRYDKWQKYCLNNLVHLCQLETLHISFILITGLIKFPDPFHRSFAFPLSLKKLSLYGCSLPWKDLSVVGSLPNLELLKLKYDSFVGKEWEPVEGEFLRLKFLLLEMLNVKCWRAENTHFPTLEHLEIIECSHLEDIPPEIPTLKLIEVKGSNLAGESALRMQEEQRDMGNDTLQVRVFNYW